LGRGGSKSRTKQRFSYSHPSPRSGKKKHKEDIGKKKKKRRKKKKNGGCSPSQ
jgi:hypothetical protein